MEKNIYLNVPSFTDRDTTYKVTCLRHDTGRTSNWTCTCPHHENRGVECKHIKDVKESPVGTYRRISEPVPTVDTVNPPVNNVLRIPTDLTNALRIVQDATKTGMEFTSSYERGVLVLNVTRS